MGWKATATVTTVNGPNAVLAAFGDAVTSDGDDHVTSVTVEISGSENTHLSLGDKVTITSDC